MANNPTTTPIMTPATGPGSPLANPSYLVDQYGNPINAGNPLAVNATVTPAANQRVNAQSGDFVAGSIVDLATLAAIVSGAKAAVKAGAGDFTDLATLAGIVSGSKAAVKAAANDIVDLGTLAGSVVSNKVQTANFIGGTAVSNTNPYPSSDMISQLIQAGQGYTATTTKLSTLTNANLVVGAGLNNNNTSKNVLIYSIVLSVPAVGFFTLAESGSALLDASLSNSLTMVNNKAGGTAASATALSTPNSNTTSSVIVGSTVQSNQINTNLANELLNNGRRILLPANTVCSASAYFTIATAGNSWSLTVSWVEY